MNKLLTNNNGVSLCITVDKNSTEILSLKRLLKQRLAGAVCLENLKIQLVITKNIHIDLVDDLLDFDITRSHIEFVLNEGSTINYQLKVIDQPNINATNDRILIAYNSQDYIEKELNFKFIGKNSQAKAKCSCKGEQSRMFRFKTLQDHQAAYTKSDLVIKGAFYQKSKFICDSLIRVNKSAKKVEASQLSKNLMLGCNSRAICIPKLEVKADDTKCKHGAVVSKLDDKQLFYLQSRGIPYCQAKNILVDAFLS